MGGLKEEIAKHLPDGAVVGEVYTDPADDTKIIIEYTLDNVLYQISPERVKIQTLLDYFKAIPLVEGLTYNDAYEIISSRHHLELIKGVDYEDNPEQITGFGRIRLPIYKYSLRFLPGALVTDIIDSNTALIGNEDARNLTDVKITITESGMRNELYKLAYKLFDCTSVKCFNDGRATIAFRQCVVEQIDASLTDVRKEILASFLLKGYSDILSDVALMIGPSEIPYFIRFQSSEGDVP